MENKNNITESVFLPDRSGKTIRKRKAPAGDISRRSRSASGDTSPDRAWIHCLRLAVGLHCVFGVHDHLLENVFGTPTENRAQMPQCERTLLGI